MKSPRFEHLGDQGLLVVFGGVIDAQVNARVHALAGVIREARLPGIRDLVPAYAALAVHYDPAAWARPGAAQLRPGEEVRFVRVSLKAAQELFLKREERFRQLEQALAQRRNH